MIEWESICRNPFTGRRAWIIRKSAFSGGPRSWSVVAIRGSYLSKSLTLCAAENIRKPQDARELASSITGKGFVSAVADRNGRIKHYVKRREGFSIWLG